MKKRVNKFSVVVLMALLCSVLAYGRENKNPFAGESLPDGWTWKRANPQAWRLRNQGLEIKIEPGNMWGGSNNAKNVLLIPIGKELQESGTDVRVTLANSPTNQWEQVDLVWYYRDSHMVKIGLELVNGKNSVVMGREEDDRTRTIKIVPIERDEVTVRLKVTGGQVQGYYRLTAEDKWADVGICEEPKPAGSSDKPQLSIQCYQGDPKNPHWARITGLKIDLVTVDAIAAVLTVSPESMQGWNIVTCKGAKANLVTYGPAVYEREKAFIADDGTDLGKGAYYAGIGFEAGTTPPSAWLGLDTFDSKALAGTALKRITSMEYYAYNAHIPVATANPNHWSSWKLWWTYPRQLIQLQLTARSPDGKQRKQFWFMPWQKRKIRGENCGRHCKKWLRYDAINFNRPGSNMSGRWFTFGPPRQEFASWADLIKAYADWTLVPTSTTGFADGGWKSAGWDNTTDPAGAPGCTATGRCLNFVVGARKEYAAVFEPESVRWANDYRGFKGYIDWFTLGIDGKSVTYNFEPPATARPPRIIELSNKEAARMRPDANDLVKISGTVVDRNNAMFALDDGSGCVIVGFLYKDVQTPENPARTGERWSVWGRIEKVPFEPVDGPPLIWTSISHMTKLSSAQSR